MKPTKRIMCPDCMRQKMLFETERKAKDFIRWNGKDIEHGENLRAYYCSACCGWHISHHRHNSAYDNNTANLIGAYNHSINLQGKRKIDRLIHQENREGDARRIFNSLPDEIKQSPSKKTVRRYLTSYFKENNMTEDGMLRTIIYRIWEQELNQK